MPLYGPADTCSRMPRLLQQKDSKKNVTPRAFVVSFREEAKIRVFQGDGWDGGGCSTSHHCLICTQRLMFRLFLTGSLSPQRKRRLCYCSQYPDSFSVFGQGLGKLFQVSCRRRAQPYFGFSALAGGKSFWLSVMGGGGGFCCRLRNLSVHGHTRRRAAGSTERFHLAV